MRLEWTLSGSVLAFILCSPHKDHKRKGITMPIIFHCAQNFLPLVILPILVLIQIALLPYDRSCQSCLSAAAEPKQRKSQGTLPQADID